MKVDPRPSGQASAVAVRERDRLPSSASPTNGDNLVRVGQVDALNRYLHAQYTRDKRKRKVVLDHREEPNPLLRLGVGVHSRIFDQPLKPGIRDSHPAE